MEIMQRQPENFDAKNIEDIRILHENYKRWYELYIDVIGKRNMKNREAFNQCINDVASQVDAKSIYLLSETTPKGSVRQTYFALLLLAKKRQQ